MLVGSKLDSANIWANFYYSIFLGAEITQALGTGYIGGPQNSSHYMMILHLIPGTYCIYFTGISPDSKNAVENWRQLQCRAGRIAISNRYLNR